MLRALVTSLSRAWNHRWLTERRQVLGSGGAPVVSGACRLAGGATGALSPFGRSVLSGPESRCSTARRVSGFQTETGPRVASLVRRSTTTHRHAGDRSCRER